MAIPIEGYGEPDYDEPQRPVYLSKTELEAMTNLALANYIESGSYDDDGFSQSARVALVRILRIVPDLLQLGEK